MPMTRARATALLNQREMALYDDSRANALRGLDAKALSSRVERARAARDRARDLARRQKLSTRERTGSKRSDSGRAHARSDDKVTLTADILRRFEAQLKIAGKSTGKQRTAAGKAPAKKAAAKKTAAKKIAKKKTATKKAAAKKAATKKSTAAKKTATKKTTTKKATKKKAAKKKVAAGKATSSAPTTRKSAANKSTGTARGANAAAASPAGKTTTRKTGGKRKRLTPKQALEQTKALLEAKQSRDRAPKPWQSAPHAGATEGQPGYQSGVAADRAQQLHDAEARLPAIMGSSSTRDRIQQGRRDHRRSRSDEG